MTGMLSREFRLLCLRCGSGSIFMLDTAFTQLVVDLGMVDGAGDDSGMGTLSRCLVPLLLLSRHEKSSPPQTIDREISIERRKTLD